MKKQCRYPRKVTIEIERCTGCVSHVYCTHHDEKKYDMYEQKLRDRLQFLIARDPNDYAIV